MIEVILKRPLTKRINRDTDVTSDFGVDCAILFLLTFFYETIIHTN